ncbi:MAG: hypothetical protein JWO20_827 [Candidatus Angelobacter sp.]|nr:hypothetical protein [Candidatus Angelobacter sp.]
MSFLSLGLQNDEQHDEILPDDPATDDSTLPAPVLIRVQGANGSGAPTSETTPVTNESDEDHTCTLPPAIEELRKKIAGNGYKPAFRRIVNDGTPTFATFKFGYLPARGLLYSIIGHEVALFGLFLLIHFGLPALRPQKLITTANMQDHNIVYLPEMGGGKEGEKSPGGGPSAPQEPSAAPAHASKGFAYPARQAILSDPPNPTNAFQTLQRPLLVHPPQLNKLVPLPNIVQMAETRLPSDLIAPKAAMPQLRPAPQPIRVKQDANTHRDAQWKVPTNDAPQLVAKAVMPKLPAAQEPIPDSPKIQPQPKPEEEKREVEKPSPNPIKVTAEKRAEKSQKQVAPLTPAQVARMEMHGKAPEPLVSLSPMPLPPGTNVKIPNGETRGRFALAPGGTLNPNSLTPGKMNVPLSTSPGMGHEKSQSANAATEVASNTGNGAGHGTAANGGSGNSTNASGSGSAGSGTGAGVTSGEGAGGTGTGKGRGSAGKGAGATSGRGAGTGSGGGSGPGSGAFQGITIQGGDPGGGNPPAFTIAEQTPYGMTVVATASSGGGLADYGVFADERVFTVYIPMKRSPEDEEPTWTLQYSLLKSDTTEVVGDQAVLAPQPVMREWPQLPADLEKKYAQRQVVILAIVDKEGKVSHVSVKQTPDARVSNPIVEALNKWVFRPAQLNSQPVAVKVLLGIPL